MEGEKEKGRKKEKGGIKTESRKERTNDSNQNIAAPSGGSLTVIWITYQPEAHLALSIGRALEAKGAIPGPVFTRPDTSNC